MTPRGRPPKRGRPKSQLPAVIKAPDNFQPTSTEKSCKIKTSQPAKNLELTPKKATRPVGRPRKYSKLEIAETPVPLGPKRGRGRPRKIKPNEDSICSPQLFKKSSPSNLTKLATADLETVKIDLTDDNNRSSLPRASSSSGSTSTIDATGSTITVQQLPKNVVANAEIDNRDSNTKNTVEAKEDVVSKNAAGSAEGRKVDKPVFNHYRIVQCKTRPTSNRSLRPQIQEQYFNNSFNRYAPRISNQIMGESNTTKNYLMMKNRQYGVQQVTVKKRQSKVVPQKFVGTPLESLMKEIMPERHGRQRQEFKKQAYVQLRLREMEMGIYKNSQMEFQENAKQIEQTSQKQDCLEKTVHAVVNTTQEQERELLQFLKKNSRMCLRDIHNVAISVGLSVEFVTLWLQHKIQNGGTENVVQFGPQKEPIELKLHSLVSQRRSIAENDTRYADFFIPATNGNSTKDQNTEQTPQQPSNQFLFDMVDEYHGRDGSSPGPSEQKEKKPAWLPKKFASSGISLDAVLKNAGRYNESVGARIDRTINFVIEQGNVQRNNGFNEESTISQTHSVPFEERYTDYSERIYSEKDTNNQAGNQCSESVISADTLNDQCPMVARFLEETSSRNPSNSSWTAQQPQFEFSTSESVCETAVDYEWPIQNKSIRPSKLLPESGELFLPTTGTLEVDLWTVDQVCQWSEFFLKAESRKELRKNGVNGFALRQLFLEDNKYWLATGMAIGDIQLLKLHTAKVINSLNGY